MYNTTGVAVLGIHEHVETCIDVGVTERNAMILADHHIQEFLSVLTCLSTLLLA